MVGELIHRQQILKRMDSNVNTNCGILNLIIQMHFDAFLLAVPAHMHTAAIGTVHLKGKLNLKFDTKPLKSLYIFNVITILSKKESQ